MTFSFFTSHEEQLSNELVPITISERTYFFSSTHPESIRLMAIRFLEGYGAEVSEAFPEPVTITNLEHTAGDSAYQELRISYQLEEEHYVLEGKFIYHSELSNENPDFFSQIQELNTHASEIELSLQ